MQALSETKSGGHAVIYKVLTRIKIFYKFEYEP
jgi:hypothetical protein